MRFQTRFLYIALILLQAIILLFGTDLPYARGLSLSKKAPPVISKGVWVTCFSEKKVLYSKEAALELIEFCKNSGISEVYIQLYRGGQAYYDSKIVDRAKYENMLKESGVDVLDFLLQEAQKNKIKVFAWVNALSVAQNKKADIIVKFGDKVLTRDQYLRPSMKGENVNKTDNYYLRDNQLFLEPGDPAVAEYTLAIVAEIISRYPAISGIHLDYARYPYPIPFLPDSRFTRYGLSYGYGASSVTRFKEKTGINPLFLLNDEKNILLWDSWKREQVTSLVEKISKYLKSASKDKLLSCAVVPFPERAYSAAFQDWPGWLEKGIVDYVVLMNYTKDNKLAKETIKSALSQRGMGKVFVGMGNFLMKDDPALLSEQYRITSDLKPDGIVFFSYDDVSNDPTLGRR